MDPSGLPGTFSSYLSFFRGDGSDIILISPSIWIPCVVPFLAFVSSAIYTWSFDRNGYQIECISTRSVPLNQLNTHCYFEGYTIPNIATYTHFLDIIHPGVGSITAQSVIPKRKEIKFIHMSLVLSAMVFLFPAILWKHMFRNRYMFNALTPLLDADLYRAIDFRSAIIKRLPFAMTAIKIQFERRHLFYSKICICKLFLPMSSILVAFIYLVMLGDDFMLYGPLVLLQKDTYVHAISLEERIFPSYLSCRMAWTGPSGSVEIAETVCLLPMSGIYRPMFTGLWFLIVGHFVLSTWSLISEVFILLPFVRALLLRRQTDIMIHPKISELARNLDTAGYAYVNMLMTNLHPTVFQELLRPLSLFMSNRKSFTKFV